MGNISLKIILFSVLAKYRLIGGCPTGDDLSLFFFP